MELPKEKQTCFEYVCDYLKLKKELFQILFERDVFRLKEKYKLFIRYYTPGRIRGFNIIFPDETGKKYNYLYISTLKEIPFFYFKCSDRNCKGRFRIKKSDLENIYCLKKHTLPYLEHSYIKSEFDPDYI